MSDTVLEKRPRQIEELRLEKQERAILDATWSYYHEGLNQSQIAENLNISRASVVNYLAEARKRNYISISLNPRIFTEQKLAQAVAERFSHKAVRIAPASKGKTEGRVAKMAADWLPHLLSPGDSLGVAWGETVFQLSEAVSPQPMDDLKVVQLVGSRPATKGFSAEICSTVLASQFGAHCINLHVPLLLSDKNLTKRLLAEPVIADQMLAVNNCNKVVFACGTCTPDSHIVKTGLISAQELETYVKKGATGVICGRLIDSGGAPITTAIEDRMIGVGLDKMKNKEMALLVGSGMSRVAPMLAAIKGGYATHLALCDETAEQLLIAAFQE